MLLAFQNQVFIAGEMMYSNLAVVCSSVFLEKRDASSVISQRHRRANTGNEESTLPANLERECLEEVCDYEEAREVFQDNYRTVSHLSARSYARCGVSIVIISLFLFQGYLLVRLHR